MTCRLASGTLKVGVTRHKMHFQHAPTWGRHQQAQGSRSSRYSFLMDSIWDLNILKDCSSEHLRPASGFIHVTSEWMEDLRFSTRISLHENSGQSTIFRKHKIKNNKYFWPLTFNNICFNLHFLRAQTQTHYEPDRCPPQGCWAMKISPESLTEWFILYHVWRFFKRKQKDRRLTWLLLGPLYLGQSEI